MSDCNSTILILFSVPCSVYISWKNLITAGVEARGFMFGPSIALAIGAKFVPLRKPRKLPGIPSSIS